MSNRSSAMNASAVECVLPTPAKSFQINQIVRFIPDGSIGRITHVAAKYARVIFDDQPAWIEEPVALVNLITM